MDNRDDRPQDGSNDHLICSHYEHAEHNLYCSALDEPKNELYVACKDFILLMDFDYKILKTVPLSGVNYSILLSDSQLYVTGLTANQILQIDLPSWDVKTIAHISKPCGLTMDKEGNLLVLSGHKVCKVTMQGEVTVIAGSDSASKSEFQHPLSITLDSGGNIFVTDKTALKKIDSQGIVSTIVSLKNPRGVAIDKYDSIFVVDDLGIQRISNGNTETIFFKERRYHIKGLSIHSSGYLLAVAEHYLIKIKFQELELQKFGPAVNFIETPIQPIVPTHPIIPLLPKTQNQTEEDIQDQMSGPVPLFIFPKGYSTQKSIRWSAELLMKEKWKDTDAEIWWVKVNKKFMTLNMGLFPRLTAEEAKAIIYYTTPMFQVINTHLCSRDIPQNMLHYFYYLINGLQKLPDWSGKVYRGINRKIVLAQNNYLNDCMVWVTVTSTSKEMRRAVSFATKKPGDKQGDGKTLQTIEVTEGKDISYFSLFPEAEVILVPNTHLRVVQKSSDFEDMFRVSGQNYDNSWEYMVLKQLTPLDAKEFYKMEKPT
eukprot:TRINITY_DN21378_c0_g1_i1.p1 TRINITY_DN21378_c0_g1~~TRINITY_DN21378_c0_g1_i1.p1  ORF type:complete len:540 (+),score=126.90 TRINITY_DN21378_c0_g1_i1:3-1622(+)